MQYLLQILWQNSSKIPVWSEVEEVATSLRMDSFRTIFKQKFTFTLKTQRTAFVITVEFPNLLKRYFSKLLLPMTACQISCLKQMFVEINFREINFRGICGFLQFRKNLSAHIFFLLLFFYLQKINPWSYFLQFWITNLVGTFLMILQKFVFLCYFRTTHKHYRPGNSEN